MLVTGSAAGGIMLGSVKTLPRRDSIEFCAGAVVYQIVISELATILPQRLRRVHWKQQLRISHGLPSRRQPCAIREAVLRHIEDTVGSDPFTRPDLKRLGSLSACYAQC